MSTVVVVDGEHVVYGPIDWSHKQSIGAYIGLTYGIAVFLPEEARPWHHTIDNNRTIAILPCVIINEFPTRTQERLGQEDVITDTEVTRTHTYTTKSLDAVRAELVHEDRITASRLLTPTDWYATRKAETDTPIPTNIGNYRQAVRDAQNIREDWLSTATQEQLDTLTGLPGWPTIE